MKDIEFIKTKKEENVKSWASISRSIGLIK